MNEKPGSGMIHKQCKTDLVIHYKDFEYLRGSKGVTCQYRVLQVLRRGSIMTVVNMISLSFAMGWDNPGFDQIQPALSVLLQTLYKSLK